MPRLGKLGLLAGWLLSPATDALAHQVPAGDAAGSLVSVSVEVEGRTAPLYPAPDGSPRSYLEARSGRRYAIRLANNSHERLGVVVMVDGLNAITGQRKGVGGLPGRMYVLDPWDVVQVWGWRTSLQEARRFTFVDERRSYAARAGKANAKMGWIEVAVHRERRPYGYGYRPLEPPPPYVPEGSAGEAPESSPSAPAEEDRSLSKERPYPGRHRRDSYPGTGWGAPAHDPVMVVDFHPQPHPAERVTLRYEYAAALAALGIDLRPWWWWDRDRLYERDRGEGGFAEPPRWR